MSILVDTLEVSALKKTRKQNANRIQSAPLVYKKRYNYISIYDFCKEKHMKDKPETNEYV